LKIVFFAYPTKESNHFLEGLEYELSEFIGACSVLQAGDAVCMQSRTRAGDSIPRVRNNEVLFEMFCFLTAIKV
jgi:predicted nucleotide-binding protein